MSSTGGDDSSVIDYSDYTVVQLKIQLRQRNIPFHTSDRKPDLINLLVEADRKGNDVDVESSQGFSSTESIQRDLPPKGHANPNSAQSNANPNSAQSSANPNSAQSKPKNAGPKAKAKTKAEAEAEANANYLTNTIDELKSWLWPLLSCGAIVLVFLSTFLAILVLVYCMYQAYAPVRSATPSVEGEPRRRLSRAHRILIGVQVVMLVLQLFWWWKQ
ncbi:MAG: hypothetical protein LQ352_004479 [Teloschistes flavicans]|nr:MAG: hypothetical protein LQ352_004479 [Teloschistes flavicans]